MASDSGEVISKTGLRMARLIQEIPAHIEERFAPLFLEMRSTKGILQKKTILGKTGIDPELPMILFQVARNVVFYLPGSCPVTRYSLLDEPTNHLDIPSIQWLEGILSRYNGAILFISHDRAFVRRLATRILELDRGQIRSWNCL